MSSTAVVDKRSLQARLYFHHNTVVNIAFNLFSTRNLYGEFFERAILDDRDAAFFFVRDVDQHLLFHSLNLYWYIRFSCRRQLIKVPASRKAGESEHGPFDVGLVYKCLTIHLRVVGQIQSKRRGWPWGAGSRSSLLALHGAADQ